MKRRDSRDALHIAWQKLKFPEKITFYSFLVAKFMFGITVVTLFSIPGDIVWVSFSIYAFLVVFTVVLAIRNWLAYHMEEDPQFIKRSLVTRREDNKMMLRINKISENADGSKEIDFDCDEEFVAWFKQKNKLKEWSQKKFEKFVFESLEKGLKNMEQDSGTG